MRPCSLAEDDAQVCGVRKQLCAMVAEASSGGASFRGGAEERMRLGDIRETESCSHGDSRLTSGALCSEGVDSYPHGANSAADGAGRLNLETSQGSQEPVEGARIKRDLAKCERKGLDNDEIEAANPIIVVSAHCGGVWCRWQARGKENLGNTLFMDWMLHPEVAACSCHSHP